MTKEEIVGVLAERARSDAESVGKVLEELAVPATERVIEAETFLIPGIVELELRIREARQARNPRSGEKIVVPAVATVTARVSHALIHSVRNGVKLAPDPPSGVPALRVEPGSAGKSVPGVRLSPEDWNGLLAVEDLAKRNELLMALAARIDSSELHEVVAKSDSSDENERDLAVRLLLFLWRLRGHELSQELVDRWREVLVRRVATAYPVPLLDQALFEVAPERAKIRVLALDPAKFEDEARANLVRDLQRFGKSEEVVSRLRQIVEGGGRAAAAALSALE